MFFFVILNFWKRRLRFLISIFVSLVNQEGSDLTSLEQWESEWQIKGVRALRGYFGPPWGQKVKVVLHKFLLISLLEQ